MALSKVLQSILDVQLSLDFLPLVFVEVELRLEVANVLPDSSLDGSQAFQPNLIQL